MNDNSSDLARAGAISRRLRGEEPAAEQAGEASYVRFSAARFRSRPAAPSPAPVVAIDEAQLSGSSGWSRVLDWCLGALDADSAFVIDAQGLVIASSGPLEGDRAQGVGARLVMAFEQADQMQEAGSQTHSIAIEFDGLWMTGLRVPTDDAALTVGILGPEPLAAGHRSAVSEAFARKASAPG